MLIGQTREKIAETADSTVVSTIMYLQIVCRTQSISAMKMRQNGDAVLLSPACASWGMFPNYEVRGKMFKEMVHALKE